jgi:hypothetical protein
MTKRQQRPNDPKAVARWDNEGGAPTSGDRATRKKRPRILVDMATGEVEDREPAADKNPASKARAEKLTADERFRIARKAAAARWKGEEG